jgi:polyisoprenoid-binding protein YceI
MHKSLILAAGLTLTLFACNNDPVKDKPKAEVAAPATSVATTTAATAGAKELKFSEADSKLSWVGAKVTNKHDGGFDKFSGTVSAVDNDPTKSSVTVDIDLASVRADDAKLVGHLKTADFFDVAKFPKAKFTSTSIKAGGADGATHTVTGNLDLHGVTKAITFPATIKLDGDTATVKAEFGMNRKDFSIVYTGKADDLIKDDVLIKLDIKAKK